LSLQIAINGLMCCLPAQRHVDRRILHLTCPRPWWGCLDAQGSTGPALESRALNVQRGKQRPTTWSSLALAVDSEACNAKLRWDDRRYNSRLPQRRRSLPPAIPD